LVDNNQKEGTDGREKRKGGFGCRLKARFTSEMKLRNNDEYKKNRTT
jgi:hypothetical protein